MVLPRRTDADRAPSRAVAVQGRPRSAACAARSWRALAAAAPQRHSAQDLVDLGVEAFQAQLVPGWSARGAAANGAAVREEVGARVCQIRRRGRAVGPLDDGVAPVFVDPPELDDELRVGQAPVVHDELIVALEAGARDGFRGDAHHGVAPPALVVGTRRRPAKRAIHPPGHERRAQRHPRQDHPADALAVGGAVLVALAGVLRKVDSATQQAALFGGHALVEAVPPDLVHALPVGAVEQKRFVCFCVQGPRQPRQGLGYTGPSRLWNATLTRNGGPFLIVCLPK